MLISHSSNHAATQLQTVGFWLFPASIAVVVLIWQLRLWANRNDVYSSLVFCVAWCCGSCLIIFVLNLATVRVTIVVSGFAFLLASAPAPLLVTISNIDLFFIDINH